VTKAQSVAFRGVVNYHHEAVLLLHEPGDAVLVERGCERSIVLNCPDGCGDLITINLDRRAGPAWRRYGTLDELTIYPSVWRETGCESHFVIWRGAIDWLESWWWSPPEEFVHNVKMALSRDWQAYFDIAERIGEIPWDVASACRELVRRNVAEEGVGASRGTFRLV
jgi:hypothetical protein